MKPRKNSPTVVFLNVSWWFEASFSKFPQQKWKMLVDHLTTSHFGFQKTSINLTMLGGRSTVRIQVDHIWNPHCETEQAVRAFQDLNRLSPGVAFEKARINETTGSWCAGPFSTMRRAVTFGVRAGFFC